jgi:von Hippel-Lindau disease tumor supressor
MFTLCQKLVFSLVCSTILLACMPSAQAEEKHAAEKAGLKSGEYEIETTIKFVNKSKKTVKIYWINFDGERETRKTLKDEETYEVETTYLTHPWLVTDENDNAWYIYFPDAQPRTVEIVAPEKK